MPIPSFVPKTPKTSVGKQSKAAKTDLELPKGLVFAKGVDAPAGLVRLLKSGLAVRLHEAAKAQANGKRPREHIDLVEIKGVTYHGLHKVKSQSEETPAGAVRYQVLTRTQGGYPNVAGTDFPTSTDVVWEIDREGKILFPVVGSAKTEEQRSKQDVFDKLLREIRAEPFEVDDRLADELRKAYPAPKEPKKVADGSGGGAKKKKGAPKASKK